jgi:hypothetical protein
MRIVGGGLMLLAVASLGVLTSGIVTGTPASGAPQDNVTFHHDPMRTGWSDAETVLNVMSVPHLQRLATLTGRKTPYSKVYAQPLYVTGERAGGQTHDLVIVATSTAQLYAYDVHTLAEVWTRSFINPIANIYQQTAGNTGCDDVNPDLGIISTPVIDRALHRLYVVVATDERSSTPRYHLRIHAVSLADGSDVVGPTEVAGSSGSYSISPLNNFSRSALLAAYGNVYVALASHCDNPANSTHGWILSYSLATLKQTGSLPGGLNTTNGPGSYFLGSPWMGGFGPSADLQGSIYFATGNGPWDGTANFSMSVLKVPSNLDVAKVDYFTPSTWSADSDADLDLGSGGAMVVPDQPAWKYPRLLIQGGKQSTGNSAAWKYILNRDKMGKLQANNAGALAAQNIAGPMYGGPAYFRDANGTPRIVYGGGRYSFHTPLTTYQLLPAPALTPGPSAVYPGNCLECRTAGSQPVVSSNGTQAGTAVAWVLKTPGNAGGTITLYAFDALKMGNPLYTSVVGPWTIGAGADYIGGAMISPLIAAGRVFVPFDGGVAVYGLGPNKVRLAAAQPAAPRPAAYDAVNRAAAPPNALFGTLTAVDGAKLTLKLRDDSSVAVDATRAVARGAFSAPLFVGKTVLVQGTKHAGAAFDAVRILRIDDLSSVKIPDR